MGMELGLENTGIPASAGHSDNHCPHIKQREWVLPMRTLKQLEEKWRTKSDDGSVSAQGELVYLHCADELAALRKELLAEMRWSGDDMYRALRTIQHERMRNGKKLAALEKLLREARLDVLMLVQNPERVLMWVESGDPVIRRQTTVARLIAELSRPDEGQAEGGDACVAEEYSSSSFGFSSAVAGAPRSRSG